MTVVPARPVGVAAPTSPAFAQNEEEPQRAKADARMSSVAGVCPTGGRRPPLAEGRCITSFSGARGDAQPAAMVRVPGALASWLATSRNIARQLSLSTPQSLPSRTATTCATGST
jgi:hypothetical protein